MPTYKEQQILDKVCKVTRQKQIKYYDFIPFFDFQYEKIIFNCQPSHFSPCSAVPEMDSNPVEVPKIFWVNLQLLKFQLPLRRSYLHLKKKNSNKSI